MRAIVARRLRKEAVLEGHRYPKRRHRRLKKDYVRGRK